MINKLIGILKTSTANTNILFGIALSIIIFMNGYLLIDRINSQSGDNGTIKDILYITQPVQSIQGRVTKIQDNTIWLENNFKTGNVSVDDEQPKLLEFKLEITEETAITRPGIKIPYLIEKQESLVDEIRLIDSIEEGMIITIKTLDDLRLPKKSYKLESITLPQIKNSITGTIIKIGEDYLVVRATAPAKDTLSYEDRISSEQIDYIVKIQDYTEISQLDTTTGSIKEFSLSDLKPQSIVTVYTNSTIKDETEIDALYVQPSQSAP